MKITLERNVIFGRDLRAFHATHHRAVASTFAARAQEAHGAGRHLEGCAGGAVLFGPDARSARGFIGCQTPSISTFEPFLRY